MNKQAMKELTPQEIRQVNGGFGIPGAIFGGITNVAFHVGRMRALGRSLTLRGFTRAAATGIVIGAMGGGYVSVARTILGGGAAGGLGYTSGLMDAKNRHCAADPN